MSRKQSGTQRKINAARQCLTEARRIVVKVGTHTLASKTGKPNRGSLQRLVEQIAKLRAQGKEVVLVSSGAVGMGLAALQWKKRPKNLAELQMAAAVGQTRLMHTYQELFAKHGLLVGQVLLTHDDFHDRSRHLNARATVHRLLAHSVIPVINENDAVSVDEIRFGDNDLLAAHISLLVDADFLVLLTTVNGLQDRSAARAKRIAVLDSIDGFALGLSSSEKGSLSSGGMKTKLQSAALAHSNGIAVAIADGRRAGSLVALLRGEDVGTLIPAIQPKKITGVRKRWLAFARRTRGDLIVDDGAVRALREKNSSLLPVGVAKVHGSFVVGDLVRICSVDGEAIAKGLVNYSHEQVARLQGCRTSEIEKILGARQFDEVVHRDNLVLL